MAITYKKAGVDMDAGNDFVKAILPFAKKTYRPGVMAGIGGFGALFALDKKYSEPILVSSTDGVGTKLKLAIELRRWDTIGQDLVAMCANDISCLGATPLFFLDYFATSRLRPHHPDLIKGIATACGTIDCALIGGETAELPGLYQGEDFDLAGFVVGVVEKKAIVDGRNISAHDCVIGVASSGCHSNGYSLVRKIISENRLNLGDPFDENGTLGDRLLTPTLLYSRLVAALAREVPLRGIAHITGGGLEENTQRIIPDGRRLVIDWNAWERPAIFRFLQEKGGVAESEMRRVFNCGVGLVVIVPAEAAEKTATAIAHQGYTSYRIGTIR